MGTLRAGVLHLREGSVDLRSLKGLSELEYVPNRLETFYVVFQKSASNEDRKVVEGMIGCELHQYIPNNAFVVLMTHETAILVESAPFVETVALLPYHHKMNQNLPSRSTDGMELVVSTSSYCGKDKGLVERVLLKEIASIDPRIVVNVSGSRFYIKDIAASIAKPLVHLLAENPFVVYIEERLPKHVLKKPNVLS